MNGGSENGVIADKTPPKVRERDPCGAPKSVSIDVAFVRREIKHSKAHCKYARNEERS